MVNLPKKKETEIEDVILGDIEGEYRVLMSPTLRLAVKEHPELIDELSDVVTKAVSQERRFHVGNSANKEVSELGDDAHYKIYEGLQTPSADKIRVREGFIFGFPIQGKTDTKESMVTKRKQSLELKPLDANLIALYESFSGGDTSSATLTNKAAGIPLNKRQTESELRLTQLIINVRYNVDPYLRNATDNLTNYIIGDEIKVCVGNPDVQEVIDDFIDQTDFYEIFKDFGKTSFLDGEVGLIIKSDVSKPKSKENRKMQWSSYKILSEEVRGFEVHRENPGKKYTYWKQLSIFDGLKLNFEEKWVADLEYFYQFNTRGNLTAFDGYKSAEHGNLSPKEVMCWFQHGDKRELRGRSPFEPILKDLRLLEDFRVSRAILNYERSKVLYIKTIKTNIQKLNEKNPTTRKSPSPKGGVQLTLGPNESYEVVSPTLHAGDAETDGLLFLYSIGAGLSMPIYILGVRADQQNYGAIKNTDSPFHQMVYSYAAKFEGKGEQIIKYVIWRAIQEKILPEKITVKKITKENQSKYLSAIEKGLGIISKAKEAAAQQTVAPKTPQQNALDSKTNSDIDALLNDITMSMEDEEIDTLDIDIEFSLAEAVKPDALELAKVAFIERKLGLVSSQTLAEERGRNWGQEVVRMLLEMKLGIFQPDGAGQQGSSNAGGGGDTAVQTGDGAKNQK